LRDGVHAVDGTPVDCVIVGINSVLSRKPSWVISGINRGGNLGTDTIYSGTVAAAVEGSLNSCRSMAVSLDGIAKVMHYETAAYVVEYLLQNLKEDELPRNCILNVNVPNVPASELRGVVAAHIGVRVYKDLVNQGNCPRGYPYIWIGSPASEYEKLADSDHQALSEGYASVSILKPSFYDVESTERLSKMLDTRATCTST
jgi:5'-nucleotidase